MMRLSLIFIVLLSLAASGQAVVPSAVIGAHLGCPVNGDVSKCVRQKFSDIIDKGKAALIKVAQTKFNGVGSDPITGLSFPAKVFGPITVSGSDISVTGLSSLKLADAGLTEDTLSATVTMDKLVIKGNFAVKMGPVNQEIPLMLSIGDLSVAAKAIFDGSSDKLAVKDVNVDIAAGSFKLDLKDAGMLQILVDHWLNDNKKRVQETLPWLSKILGGWLKKTLVKYVAKV